MIEEMSDLIPTLTGAANHTHCFLHVVNLVAKSLIQQFDVKKDAAEDDELKELWQDLVEEEAKALNDAGTD